MSTKLAKRVIPCLDVQGGRVVKGTRFVDLRDAGDPVPLASRYDREGADEVVFLDITASVERRRTAVELARRVAETLSIPFCVGGGIGSVDVAAAILRAGADKVAVNTAAVSRSELVSELSAERTETALRTALPTSTNSSRSASGDVIRAEPPRPPRCSRAHPRSARAGPGRGKGASATGSSPSRF